MSKKMCENIPAFIEKYRDVSDLGLKWDVIKMEIRSFTVQYSKRKARLEKDKENQLLTKLNDLQEKLCSSRNDLNLLNEYYTLKAKLEKLLNKKIKGTNQTGYIKGRYIGENVRLISDIISYTAAKNLPGLAIFLDFEKAFDSIEWNFLFKALDKLNFGPDFKIGYEPSIATSLAVLRITVMPLIFSIWSEALDRVAHYQAFSSCSELKFLHLRLRKIRELRASE